MKTILETKELCKYYGSGENIVKAVDNIDISIQQGEFVTIVGKSGSGKSTLLHLLGGLDNPTSGEVWLDGKNIAEFSEERLAQIRRRKIGFVFQAFNLVSSLNVWENVVLPLGLDGRRVDINFVKDIINTLGLDKKVKNLPNTLSGGQQQRTAIGRAIVKNPAILLCDEPTGALDYKTSKEILKLIETVNEKYGNTIIMVTHNDAIKDMATRVVRLKDGMIRSNVINEKRLHAEDLEW